MSKLRVVHYLNQFFAGVGGETEAGLGPRVHEGPLGPGRLLAQRLGQEAEIVATVFCGDDYANERAEDATEAILGHIQAARPDLVVAGPAFNSGRYGLACGQVCTAVQDRLGVPTVAGMHEENPGVELYRARVYIVQTSLTAAGMASALERMAALGLKLARRQPIGLPRDEGYLPRGLRYAEIAARPAAARAVDMLLQRVRGEPFETEWPLPVYDRVPPPPPIADLSKATIALVTSGGIVPKGNPDRIESTFATKWLKYSLEGVTDLTAEKWQSVHGGYNTTNANDDPDRVLPVDAMRALEAEGVIGHLHENYYVFVGSGASTVTARKFAQQMATEINELDIQGVILTAT
jgi:glycine reductase